MVTERNGEMGSGTYSADEIVRIGDAVHDQPSHTAGKHGSKCVAQIGSVREA